LKLNLWPERTIENYAKLFLTIKYVGNRQIKGQLRARAGKLNN